MRHIACLGREFGVGRRVDDGTVQLAHGERQLPTAPRRLRAVDRTRTQPGCAGGQLARATPYAQTP